MPFSIELNWLICTAILFAIIVPSNFLVVKVWNMRKSKTPIPLLLSAIAISDSIFITLDLYIRILFYTDFANGRCLGGHIVWPFENCAHFISTLITAYIAVQRCTVCAFPFKGPKLLGNKATIIYIVTISILVILQQAAWTVFIKDLKPVHLPVPGTNTTMMFCEVKLFITVVAYIQIRHIARLTQVFICRIGTFVVVVLCMAYCVYCLQFKRMPSSQKASKSTTVMVVLVMLLFSFGSLPGAVGFFIANVIDPIWFFTGDKVYICSAINKVSFALHIAVYLAMSRQFRNDFLSIFCAAKTMKKTSPAAEEQNQ